MKTAIRHYLTQRAAVRAPIPSLAELRKLWTPVLPQGVKA
jgi:hypothetical protein